MKSSGIDSTEDNSCGLEVNLPISTIVVQVKVICKTCLTSRLLTYNLQRSRILSASHFPTSCVIICHGQCSELLLSLVVTLSSPVMFLLPRLEFNWFQYSFSLLQNLSGAILKNLIKLTGKGEKATLASDVCFKTRVEQCSNSSDHLAEADQARNCA